MICKRTMATLGTPDVEMDCPLRLEVALGGAAK